MDIIGNKYESKHYGEFTVVCETGRDPRGVMTYMVEFTATGYEKYGVLKVNILHGRVKDPYKPSVYGVGFIGDDEYVAKVNGKTTPAYKAWENMLRRCYCHKKQKACPTYVGCTVDPEWHNYQKFARWFEANHIEGYHLDKDKLVKGNRVYGPSTCCYISPQENIEVSQAKTYAFTNPDGERIEIFNLRKFCLENGLYQSNMWGVHAGKYKQHKGWRKA